MKKFIFCVLLCWAVTAQAGDGKLSSQMRVNPTYSPDSTKIAFTRGNDLWVEDVATNREYRLTSDGSDLILNGFASWVYYEEILGRASRYKSFWWSPDSRRIGFYRFDNTAVPYFPIYSPFAGHDVSAPDHAGYPGHLNNTRYPKAGQANPLVRIGIVDVGSAIASGDAAQSSAHVDNAGSSLTEGASLSSSSVSPDSERTAGAYIVWADFPVMGGTSRTATKGCTVVSSYGDGNVCDGYFGIPFWSADSRDFYVPTLPRIQNDLNLFAVDALTGAKQLIYNEKYPTWIEWFESMEFGCDGLYVARRFETGWDQIYYISYDGKTVLRLTDSKLWSATVLKADERRGKLYFSAKIDGAPRAAVFSVDIPRAALKPSRKSSGTFSAVAQVSGSAVSTQGASVAAVSGSASSVLSASSAVSLKALTPLDMNASGVKFADDAQSFTAYISNSATPTKEIRHALKNGKVISAETVKDFTPEDFDAARYALPQLISMTTKGGFTLPALITYPKSFDPSGATKYPVVMEIYGGPDTPYVRDQWRAPSEANQWFAENGIIKIVCDSRAAGHNGRAGEDMVYKDVTSWPVSDFCEWADYLAAQPYVDAAHIGVEGFSFGGTMTTMLVMRHSDKFCCGIAGGGVYDWALYDTHYTERYMETPETNPDGYARACALNYVNDYPSDFSDDRVMLRLTHGTGDDNVHFQNTLILIDALQKAGRHFELMIYPDGLHGYRGYQGAHSLKNDHDFWLSRLFG